MIQAPILLADFLGANSLETLGRGELLLPEVMLNRLLSAAPLPLPLERVDLTCQSGFFLLKIQLDLREQGLPLRPQVQQMFELERLRLDPHNQFLLLRPRGGLYIDEGSISRRRLSPVARALLTTLLHTPTLLKLVRDRFPKNVQYEHGRLHIDLSGLGPIQELIQREVPLGHIQLKPLEFINIQDIDIRKGALVLLFRFEKEPLLLTLRADAPPGFYQDPSQGARHARKMLPPPEERVRETPAERALRLGRVARDRGLTLLDRLRKP
jgi:hypothetical protein